jgi:hypothetical protein
MALILKHRVGAGLQHAVGSDVLLLPWHAFIPASEMSTGLRQDPFTWVTKLKLHPHGTDKVPISSLEVRPPPAAG